MTADPTAAGSLLVLRYGRIGPPPPENWLTASFIDEAEFGDHLRAIRQSEWEALDSDTFLAALDDPSLRPERAVLVTLDVPYSAVLDVALPTLRTFRCPAVLFVPPDLVDEKHAIGSDADLPEAVASAQELRGALNADVSVQSLGLSGRPFSRLQSSELEDEITRSRDRLAAITEQEVELLAYPGGDLGRQPDATTKIVRLAGYRAAFTLESGVNRWDTMDVYRLKRLSIDSSTDLEKELRS